ncbi:MAG: isochorismate synthase, partial [Deltaproteobacteria bacterium]|nr:isochorismate synthase [Deltaproteobacteria bacterium]
FSDNLNHFTILQKLKDKASNSYKFCFQPEDNLAFIGASPELLYYREGRKLKSEAVAGTRTRGRTSREDQGFGEELLGSEKDLREHRYVVDSVKDAFVSLTPPSLNCNNMSVSLLKLARIQHLIARFDIKLKDSVSDAELIETLHPTAAVGGYPRDKAVEEIGRLEGFNRGWYAAPVGWVKQDAAKFVVAIRCGLVKNNCLSLYSGAGIVRGSVPDNEWDEMNNKIDMFLSVLT